MIKYLGSKRLLVPLLLETVRGIAPSGTVVDLFSGTSRVGHALKAAGYRVVANDHNAYAATLARCYVESDLEDMGAAPGLLAELSRLPGSPGYFTETFCRESRFFQPKNGERVDAIREAIRALSVPPGLEAVLLVSLLEAADRVDSTTGVQMAYLKQWAPRSYNDLELRMPAVLPRAASGKGAAHQADAVTLAGTLEADVLYLDPPYNQHSYLGNYHAWESLVTWDKPAVYGIACKRMDVRERGSAFNRRRTAFDALAKIVRTTPARALVVSFSNEGYIDRDAMTALLAERGEVEVITRDFKRYVGAQIGVHNPAGKRVGVVSHLRNEEHVFVVRG